MKTNIIFASIAAMAVMTLFTSCEKISGKGEVITESRSVSGFSSINLAMSATVYYTQDSVYSLTISGQENILREIVTGVEGNTLVIREKNGVVLKNFEPVRVYVTAPAITGLEISGSGDIFTNGTWTGSALSLNISGSGSINLAAVESDNLTAKISGSGSVKAAAGDAGREELKISGSGTIDLRSVMAGSVFTTTSGSGDTYVHATDLLDATISGSGNIWYYGTPAINTHISGSGNLRRM